MNYLNNYLNMTTKVYKFMKMFVSFKEYETEQGKLIVDELVEGADANVIDKNGELIPAKDGEYITEDGKITIAEGKVVSIETIEEKEEVKEEELEENEETKEEKEESEEETKPEEEEEVKEDPVEEPKEEDPELIEARNRIAELEGKLAEAEAKIAELEEELNKPTEKPLEMKATARNTIAASGALKYFVD